MSGTSSNPGTATPNHQGDWWVVLGLAVSAIAAAVSSFSGLTALARVTGWQPWMAPLLPATVDALAATATRLWVSSASEGQRVRRLARTCALGAILLSLAGNACDHLVSAGLVPVTWPVVLAVGAVPALVLGLVAHLAALRRVEGALTVGLGNGCVSSESAAAETDLPPDSPAPDPVVLTPVPVHRSAGGLAATEDDLLTAARRADEVYRTARGRGITRDALRAELHVSGSRASQLLRQLRAEDADQLPATNHEKGGRRS